MNIRHLFAAGAVATLSVFSACVLPEFLTGKNGKKDTSPVVAAGYQGPRLMWFSLDGLRRSDVEKYLAMTPNPHAFGFKKLLQNAQWNPQLKITNPTITASSHVSTITCTPPGVHGIIANKQWNGTAMVSGFSAPYKGETFAASLKRQGLNVIAVGYAGIDDGVDDHTPTQGVGYDTPLATNKPVFKELAAGQTDSFDVPSRLTENALHQVVVKSIKDVLQFELPNGEVVSAGLNQWAHLNFMVDGKKEQVPVFIYEANETKTKYYISPTGLNKATPESFRQHLDDANIIFSNAKDYGMLKVSDDLYIKGLAHRTDFFTQATLYALENERPDAMFVYFEDLDTLGHQYSGDDSKDAVRASHFAKLDASIGAILEKLPASTNVLLMGDHGMSTIQYEINGNLLLPAEFSKNYLTLSSGGAFFLYGKNTALDSTPDAGDASFAATVDALRNATVEFDSNRKVFAKVVVKGSDEAKELGLVGDDMPWVMAFADPGLSVSTSIEPKFLMSRRADFVIPDALKEKFPDPMNNGKLVIPLAGAHGHYNESLAMRTSLIMYGPDFSRVEAANVNMNIDVVPAVADVLQLNRPAGCQK